MNRFHLVLTIAFALGLAGCVFFGPSVREVSRQTYTQQIEEIERAHQNQQITKAEYLKLKMEAGNAFRQREATIVGGGR